MNERYAVGGIGEGVYRVLGGGLKLPQQFLKKVPRWISIMIIGDYFSHTHFLKKVGTWTKGLKLTPHKPRTPVHTGREQRPPEFLDLDFGHRILQGWKVFHIHTEIEGGFLFEQKVSAGLQPLDSRSNSNAQVWLWLGPLDSRRAALSGSTWPRN